MKNLKDKLASLKKASFYSVSAVLAVSAVGAGLLPEPASAASLTQTLVRFDRLQTSQQTTGTVCAMPATVATEASVQVVYPTGYTLGAAGAFTVNTTNLAWPSGANAWPGIGTATNVTSQTVTFPSGDLTVGTLYCFNWASATAVQVKSGATSNNTGSVTTRTSTPANIDTGNYSTVSLSGDQISVTASVPQSFTFTLTGTTDALGNLSTSSVVSSASPSTITINTNAGGWMAWAQDAFSGLRSVSAGNHTIPSRTPGTNTTLSVGTEFHNLGVTSSQVGGSGTVSVDTAFVGGSTGRGGGLDTSLRTLATSNGTADTAVLTLTNNVAISSLTNAATDYTDTITVVGAASF